MASVRVMLKKGGFACELVTEPPEAVQFKCSVCCLILREPYQVSCCGYSFCQLCIQAIKDEKKSCPVCKKPKFSVFHNKGLQRSLYGFQVYCSHKQEGCKWKGELGQLDNHLNLSPQPRKQLEGCKYSEIKCIYCSELIKRGHIANHQSEQCPKRPFSCEYCKTYKGCYEDVVNDHLPVCGSYPVQCRNKCGETLRRQVVNEHVNAVCPKTVIDCAFNHVGCDVRLSRKDMPAHLQKSMTHHMSLQTTRYKQLQERVQEMENREATLTQQLQSSREECQRATARMQEMQQQMILLKLTYEAEVQFAKPILKRKHLHAFNTIELTMQNYRQHKRARDTWYSEPFYSHPAGYKLSLGICANGYGPGTGTHASVTMYLLQGEFDDQLEWPIRGEAVIQILKRNGKGFRQNLYLNKLSHNGGRGRMARPNEFGFPMFVLHTVLQQHYIRDDCLYFKIKFKR